jgi:hypothetical protein
MRIGHVLRITDPVLRQAHGLLEQTKICVAGHRELEKFWFVRVLGKTPFQVHYCLFTAAFPASTRGEARDVAH